ncbi:hypothetical protein CFIMG_006196RA [Ceratocystis fimbriata CBS 114723]|uniref:Uncharacterized protein n=1 Tax=Ceratocystis fimbriata CBS 114723 TaxID=1035309 RepID=A0A2C5WJI1_9PEZI|nr:hypothetical protein CFIMG_006196RA [Ceratocystis fimbriata CBS 114723]
MTTKTLSASCKGCKFSIGDFVNSWVQVGKNYFTPCEAPQNVQIQDKGKPRTGERDTLVDGCELQDVCCPMCRTILGLKCVSTPQGHALVKEQLLLREPNLCFKSGRRGSSPKLSVKEVWNLRDRRPLGENRDTQGSSHSTPQSIPTSRASPKKKPAAKAEPIPTPQPSKLSRTADASNGSTTAKQTPTKPNKAMSEEDAEAEYAIPAPKPSSFFPEACSVSATDLAQMRTDINRIDTAGYQVISAFDHAVSRMDGDIKKAQDSATQISTDIVNVRDDVGSLKTDVAGLKNGMSNTVSVSVLEAEMNAVTAKIGEAVAPIKKDMAEVKALAKKKATETDTVKKDVVAIKTEAKGSKTNLQNVLARTDSLEQELGASKKAHKESLQMIKEQSSEILALKNEVKKLRYEIEASNHARRHADASQAQSQAQQRTQSQQAQATGMTSQDLDILTTNLASIGTKAAMVETLQMEFQLFRSRFQRLEQMVSGSQQQIQQHPKHLQQTPLPMTSGRSVDDRYQGLATADQTPSDQNHARQYNMAYSAMPVQPQFSMQMPSLLQTHTQPHSKPPVQPQPQPQSQPQSHSPSQRRKRSLPASLQSFEDKEVSDDDDDDDDRLLQNSPPRKRLHLGSAPIRRSTGPIGQEPRASGGEDIYRWSPSPPGARKTSSTSQASLLTEGARTRPMRATRKSYASRKE